MAWSATLKVSKLIIPVTQSLMLYPFVMLLELYRACPDLFYLIVRKVPFDDYISVAQTCIRLKQLLVTNPTRNVWQWYEGKSHDMYGPSKGNYNKAFEKYVEICYNITDKLLRAIDNKSPSSVLFWMQRRIDYFVYPYIYQYALDNGDTTLSKVLSRDIKPLPYSWGYCSEFDDYAEDCQVDFYDEWASDDYHQQLYEDEQDYYSFIRESSSDYDPYLEHCNAQTDDLILGYDTVPGSSLCLDFDTDYFIYAELFHNTWCGYTHDLTKRANLHYWTKKVFMYDVLSMIESFIAFYQREKQLGNLPLMTYGRYEEIAEDCYEYIEPQPFDLFAILRQIPLSDYYRDNQIRRIFELAGVYD
jgi:hypothetical protein